MPHCSCAICSTSGFRSVLYALVSVLPVGFSPFSGRGLSFFLYPRKILGRSSNDPPACLGRHGVVFGSWDGNKRHDLLGLCFNQGRKPFSVVAVVVSLGLWVRLRIKNWQSLAQNSVVSFDLSHVLLLALFVLSLVPLLTMPMDYRNFAMDPQGYLRISPLPDIFFHLSIAQELTHAVPPQISFFANKMLSYHYMPDLLSAMFHNGYQMTKAQNSLFNSFFFDRWLQLSAGLVRI